MKTAALRARIGAFFLCITAAACQPENYARADDLPIGAGFDFYVLSLSWSPSYCAAEGEEAGPPQCGGPRPYGFIVHGLWPQFERGYPENCRTGQPLDMPRERVASLMDIMPSSGLIRHQWRKHGACAGLTQHDYFSVLRAAWERVALPGALRELPAPRRLDPDQVEEAFLSANPDLPEDGIAVTCDRRYLREIRICMTKELDFRSCAEVDRRGCRLDSAIMPAVR